jgi:NAD(P)-dependent dehydrogenase (short-subunit alcohol dehydrogenase family)
METNDLQLSLIRKGIAMHSPFGFSSTIDDVLAGVDLAGKRVLLTGVSAGLGTETARGLLSRGATVVGTARDMDKARSATARLGGEPGQIDLVELDLASLDSVRRGANAIAGSSYDSFDVIIANAGVMTPGAGKTRDGFEIQMGTNHLGHFVLVNRLAHLLSSGGRLVMVASAGHRISDVDLDDLNYERRPFDDWAAYGQSKTANILFAVEFDRRHKGRGVRATALHPGGIQTELSRHIGREALDAAVAQFNAAADQLGIARQRWKSVAQGTATTAWAAFVANAEEIGGRYCEDCSVAAITDHTPSPLYPGVRSYALDPDRAQQLWAMSEKLVGEAF